MTVKAQLLPGTLDLLILRAVSLGPLHGYGILLRIGQISDNSLLIEQGALYPGLFRLARQGLSRRAKFDSNGHDESRYLRPLQEFVARGISRTRARRRLLAKASDCRS